MYCVNCGTMNVDGANFCVKCGKGLGSPAKDQKDSLGDLGPISRAPKTQYWRPKTISTRLILFGLVVAVSTILPGVILYSQLDSAEKSNFSALIGGAETLKGAGGLTPDSEALRRSAGKSIGGIRIPSATDLKNRADAYQLQMVIVQFYTMNSRLPESLSELPKGVADFDLDPKVFEYEPLENPFGFRIKVEMESKYPSGEDMINENKTSKFVLDAAL